MSRQRALNQAANLLKRPSPLARLEEAAAAAGGLRVSHEHAAPLHARAAAARRWLERALPLLEARGGPPPPSLREVAKEAKPLMKVEEVGAAARRLGEAEAQLQGAAAPTRLIP